MLVLVSLYLLDGPVQRLAGLYESDFALAVIDPASLLGILLGIELLFNGASLIVLAFFLRTAKKHLDA